MDVEPDSLGDVHAEGVKRQVQIGEIAKCI